MSGTSAQDPATSPDPFGLRAALPPAERYWVAFSGGLDSTVLLHAARAALGDAVAAVHVHHGLHADAEDWAQRCAALARSWALECRILRVDAGAAAGESPEAAARAARYGALRTLVGPNDCLVLAHHLDDQAETVLLQLLRGAGARGLAAMPTCAPFGGGRVARPLLAQTRAQLEAYARTHGLVWTDDPSNRDARYDRNYLRAEILPRLRARWPSADSALAQAARHAAQAAILADALAEIDLTPVVAGVALRIPALRALGPARRDNVLRHWLRTRGCTLPDPAHLRRVVEEVMGAASDRTPLVAWGQVEVRRYRDRLYAGPPLPDHDPTRRVGWDLAQPLELNGVGRLSAHKVQGAGLRAAALAEGVVIGFRHGGERCTLAGRSGTRSVKKLLQEGGVPPWLRSRLPLIFVGDTLAQIGDAWRCAEVAAGADEPGIAIRWEPLPGLRVFLTPIETKA